MLRHGWRLCKDPAFPEQRMKANISLSPSAGREAPNGGGSGLVICNGQPGNSLAGAALGTMLLRWRAFSMSAPQTGDRSRVDALPRIHMAFLALVMATFSLQCHQERVKPDDLQTHDYLRQRGAHIPLPGAMGRESWGLSSYRLPAALVKIMACSASRLD